MRPAKSKKAVFLDRDGTLIEDGPFLSNPEGIRFLNGSIAALQALKRRGFLLVLITNQSGVGRGHFTEESLQRIHARLQDLLEAQAVKLDAIYCCPHSPEAKCKCRKPEPGLFLKAIRDHTIDPSRSYAVGDKPEDAVAAKQVGCKTILLPNSSPGPVQSVDFKAQDVTQAVRWILKQDKRGEQKDNANTNRDFRTETPIYKRWS